MILSELFRRNKEQQIIKQAAGGARYFQRPWGSHKGGRIVMVYIEGSNVVTFFKIKGDQVIEESSKDLEQIDPVFSDPGHYARVNNFEEIQPPANVFK